MLEHDIVNMDVSMVMQANYSHLSILRCVQV